MMMMMICELLLGFVPFANLRNNVYIKKKKKLLKDKFPHELLPRSVY